MNVKHLTPAQRLMRLYNAGKPFGMGMLQYDPTPMTEDEAQSILNERGGNTYFDYLKGRLIKTDVGTDEIDGRLYDRDYGHGAAERALS